MWRARQVAWLVLVGGVAFAGAGCSDDPPSEPTTAQRAPAAGSGSSAAPGTAVFEHGAYSALLAARVSDGLVDYAALQADPAPLAAYLARVSEADVAALSVLERHAFWINAYNALTLASVLRHLPADRGAWPGFSVKKVDGFWQAPHRVARRELSLDQIEHLIRAAEFDDAREHVRVDARIHFALVCASRGCPPLRAEAYVGARLDAQLDAQTRAFVRDRSRVAIDATALEISASPLFSWYAQDFADDAECVSGFLARHVEDAALAAKLRSAQWTLSSLDYDWRLNLRP